MTFLFRGKELTWKGGVNEEPRVLQRNGGHIFIVSQKDSRNLRLRRELIFYRSSGEAWSQIGTSDFPPELAKCNLSPDEINWRAASENARKSSLPDYEKREVQEMLEAMFSGRNY